MRKDTEFISDPEDSLDSDDLLGDAEEANEENDSALKIISAGDGKCTAELKVDESHLNLNSMLHGGMTATLVDVVSTLALITNEGAKPGASVEISVSYMKGAKMGEELVINASTLKAGKTLAFLDVGIINKATGSIIASGKHTKYIA